MLRTIHFVCLALLTWMFAYDSSAGPSVCVRFTDPSLHEKLAGLLHKLDGADALGRVLSIRLPECEALVVSDGYVGIKRLQKFKPNNLFQIGSQTKMFTAAAILLLEKQGKLKIDDPVSYYLPAVPRAGQLTIKHLLQHTGGIGDSIIFFDPPDGSRPDFEVTFANHLFLNKVIGEQFAPGEGWEYNNLGFVLLGKIVEKASGQSLNAFTRDAIFEPLGMLNSYLGSLELYPEAQMARGYFGGKSGKDLIDSTMPELSWASSAGDMVSNIEDLNLWGKALLDTSNALGISLVDFIPEPVHVSSTDNLRNYGFGMMERNLGGNLMWGHGGFIQGYVTITLIDPGSGVLVQLMCNMAADSEDIMVVMQQTLEAALAAFQERRSS